MTPATLESLEDRTLLSSVSITANDPDAAEPADDGQFTVSLDFNRGDTIPTSDVVVNYTVGGTATNGTDYATLSGSVTIPVGQTSATIEVDVVDENLVELDETVTVTINSVSDPTVLIGVDNSATVTISNDDSAIVNIDDATVTEGGDLQFAVTLTNPADSNTVVSFFTENGTATVGDNDYTPQLIISGGDNFDTYSDGSLAAQSDWTGGTISDGTVNGYLPGKVMIGGGNNASLDVLEQNGSVHSVTVDTRVVGGSIADFIKVQVYDPSNTANGFNFRLADQKWRFQGFGVSNAISGNYVSGDWYRITVSIDPTANGGSGSATMDVLNLTRGTTFSPFANTPLNMSAFAYTLDSLTAVSLTTGADDEIASIGSVGSTPSITIPAGQTSGVITVATTDDLDVEADETMTVRATAVEAGGRDVRLSRGSFGTGTILNNDADNTPPDANDDAVSTSENDAVTFNVLDNDTDAENNVVAGLTVATSSPSTGVLTDTGNGTFTFDPNGDFESLPAGQSTTVSFDYQIEDSFGETDSATVTITINGVNDVASISGDNAGSLTEDEAGDSGVMSVSDVDSGEAVFQAQSGTVGDYGDFSIDVAGNWSYARTADLQA
ncbi:MAG: VCBS domain-containing protein, partial [Planctomycetota bacterium]|nr:VCBS domain-containing protein [Planctomycetota bacterium]